MVAARIAAMSSPYCGMNCARKDSQGDEIDQQQAAYARLFWTLTNRALRLAGIACFP
jgi:hypothetical protein